jgi:hypothetical protein
LALKAFDDPAFIRLSVQINRLTDLIGKHAVSTAVAVA